MLKRIKFLTGLVGNGILILFIAYLSADLFSWLIASLVNWVWVEPSFTVLILLISSSAVIGMTGLLNAFSYVWDAIVEVWEGEVKPRKPRF